MDADKAHALAREMAQEQLELLRTLARIPAPTGFEDERAAFVSSWLQAAGATRVEVDAAKNVLCWVRDTPGVPIELFSAHTDVVFADTEPLPLVEEGPIMRCPGVGDDTACLVNLLLATRHLIAHPALTQGRSILVVANSCEEGLGNLAGTWAVYERYGSRIASHVAFDCHLGEVVARAVGSLCWRVEARGPGGHSWRDYGRPSAVSALAHLVCALEEIELPERPRTTMNVGVISGGTTVNAIAEEAEMLVDLRSEEASALEEARAAFEEAFERAGLPGLAVRATLIGTRPAGASATDEAQRALVERARAIVWDETGADPGTTASSTDANVPLSLGIPAVCLGTVAGGGAHTRAEWVDTRSLVAGLSVTLQMMN